MSKRSLFTDIFNYFGIAHDKCDMLAFYFINNKILDSIPFTIPLSIDNNYSHFTNECN